jgi:hypothetical protein
MENVGEDFHGNSYDLYTKFVRILQQLKTLSRNCNHFSEEFSRRLVGKSIPGWVNRLAWYGNLVRCILPKMGETPTASEIPSQSTEQQSQFVPFSGSFKGFVNFVQNGFREWNQINGSI